MKAYLFALFLLSSPAFASGGSSTVGNGNPATRFCTTAGGEYEIYRDGRGNQYGFCVFDSSAAIDGWTLRNYKNGQQNQAVTAFLASRRARRVSASIRAAAANCASLGGSVQALVGLNVCSFSDRSAIEILTLYRGTNARENASLLNVLNHKTESK